MKLECSVEELKLLFKNFELKENEIKIKIDGEEINNKLNQTTIVSLTTK